MTKFKACPSPFAVHSPPPQSPSVMTPSDSGKEKDGESSCGKLEGFLASVPEDVLAALMSELERRIQRRSEGDDSTSRPSGKPNDSSEKTNYLETRKKGKERLKEGRISTSSYTIPEAETSKQGAKRKRKSAGSITINRNVVLSESSSSEDDESGNEDFQTSDTEKETEIVEMDLSYNVQFRKLSNSEKSEPSESQSEPSGVQIAGAGLTAGTQGKMYPIIYSEDAYNSDPSIDSAYYSYCPDPSPFNKTLVKGKILICNFVEYFSGGAVAQISNAVQTATSIGAAGLLVLAQAADRVKSKTTISDPFPFTIPATFVQDANASSAILEYYHASTTRNEKGGVKLFGAHARIKDSRNASYTLTAPKVASYSSRGPVYADTVSSLVADIIKPDVLAPGHQIWGAWVPEGIEGNAYNGYRFAMVSGTSMAAPHIAGIAALIRQKYPNWSPSAIRSAILTTASQFDNREKLIRAEQPSANASLSMGRASPFDYGSGAVNATGAMDPGLVFDADFQDYVNFVCLVPGADENSVQYSTGAPCGNVAGAWTSDLNMPYIAVANLLGTRVMPRTVKNVALRREEYNVTVRQLKVCRFL